MRRIVLNNDQKQLGSILSSTPKKRAKLTEAELNSRLREKRSNRYMEALRTLDAGHLAVDSVEYNELIAVIHEELPDPDSILGIVAKCYLGPPYEVHTLDLAGGIIEHYPPYQSLPPSLERARSLARHDGYAFVEVYNSKMVAIAHDGTASIVK